LNNIYSYSLVPHRLKLLRGVLAATFPVILLIGGCQPLKSPDIVTTLAEPVLGIKANDIAAQTERTEFHDCLEESEQPLGNGPVREVLLTYINAGRDFRDPQGPDGYVLRIIPLDNKYRPVPVPAEINIALYPATVAKNNSTYDPPMRFWRISAPDLARHWTPSALLDGYLLRLDWGEISPGPGNYILLVSFSYKHKKNVTTICRIMTFQDQLTIEQFTTPQISPTDNSEREAEK